MIHLKFQNHCEYQIPAAILINKRFLPENLNDREIHLKGDLDIRQYSSLQCPYFLRHVQSHFYFENLNVNKTNLESYKISELMDNINKNPASFYFNEFSFNYGKLTTDKTTINVNIKIHELKIRYRKTFWRILIEKWILYLSIFLITAT